MVLGILLWNEECQRSSTSLSGHSSNASIGHRSSWKPFVESSPHHEPLPKYNRNSHVSERLPNSQEEKKRKVANPNPNPSYLNSLTNRNLRLSRPPPDVVSGRLIKSNQNKTLGQQLGAQEYLRKKHNRDWHNRGPFFFFQIVFLSFPLYT